MSDKFNVSQSSAHRCHRWMPYKTAAATRQRRDYLNRKGYYSVVLQGIVDERGRFRTSMSEHLDQQRNTNICRGRVVVEQAFGRVKCKWRRMRDLQNTRLDVVVMLIMSACMLHNLCTGPADMCQEHPAGCPRHEDENI
ncbi:hypothetical protein AAFF_G00345200 [Aldrovandia affinis]|uniref:DDE Tnp4 domain-containing protein n=1 Tax=Aldrovandia affinis TaxID=143900 RepID=A0AAD7R5N7_9TELE|nr:hypothetical protein AAFF_G00345200 [Aldrovandia affinis]